MMQAFGRPLEELTFYDPRVGTQSTRRVETPCEGVHGKGPDKFSISCSYWGEIAPCDRVPGDT
jgi:hypothetical protein